MRLPTPPMPKTPAALASLAATVLLAGGCAIVDPHGILARRAPAGAAAQDGPVPSLPRADLGREGRATALDFVWNTINERYYDPRMNGVDWRAVRADWEPRLLAAASGSTTMARSASWASARRARSRSRRTAR